jgi:thioredoxin-like negative regulator of GroEL
LYFLCLLLALADPAAQVGSLLQQGLTALQQGRLQQAREHLEGASKLDPNNPYAWTSLAETYLRLKDPSRASAAASTAEKVGVQDPIVWHALAVYYSESGDFDRAAQFEARFAESPKVRCRRRAARAAGLYLNAGNAGKALTWLGNPRLSRLRPCARGPSWPSSHCSGQATEGTQHFAKAWQMSPKDRQITFDYAQALLRKEDFPCGRCS